MSRCFPYPPPGYTRNGIRDEALIESIKLQREIEVEKAKKEKKEKKREKEEREKVRGNEEVESKREKEERKKQKKREKEERKKQKKREKEEREKVRGNGEVEGKRRHHKKRHRDERSLEDQKGGDFEKKRKYESEHYEKSSLTEEHGNPAGSQNSSDSTLNSKKIQKQGSPSGSIIRIRFPLQRLKDSELLPTKEQPCSALGMSESTSVEGTSDPAPILGREGLKHPCSTSQSKDQELFLPVSKDKSHLCCGASGSSILQAKSTSDQGMSEPAPILGREGLKHPCSTSQSEDQKLPLTVSKDKSCLSHGASGSSTLQAKPTLHTGLCGSSPPPVALQFRDLVENWVPSNLQSEYLGSDNQTWLFGINQEQSQNSKARRCEVGSVGSNYLNSTSWPHAHYLPDAEVYALPFTVPF